MSLTALGLALIAGVLSTLSPCVLPLLPIVIGTAASEHRFGPLALAVGLAVSFVVIGMLVSTVGLAVGLDGDTLRIAAAGIMVLAGAALLLPRLQQALTSAATPLANWASGTLSSGTFGGWHGQFAVGLLLGMVWSPCVGPTLGAASALAAQGKDLPQVTMTMLLFGIGAALPLLLAGMVSREAMLRMRGRLMSTGGAMKKALGAMLVVVGLSVATGLDKLIEARLVDWSPEWLTALTTRF